MTLGQKIKRHRTNSGMTQSEYGEKYGATKSMVSKWESGTNKPNIKRLKLIADDLGITVIELLEGEKHGNI